MARRRYRAAHRLGVLAAGCLLGIVLSSQMTSADGISGCMHRALLSSHRTALIRPLDGLAGADPRYTARLGECRCKARGARPGRRPLM